MGSEISTIPQDNIETEQVTVTQFQHENMTDEKEYLLEKPVKKNKLKRSKSLDTLKK